MKSILPEVSSSDLLINELLYAINKVNYNQTDNINALAGMGNFNIYILTCFSN